MTGTQPSLPEAADAGAQPQGPVVLLGVTGGIAAYKSCELVRMLQKAGLRVKVVMTAHATEFVTPATFKALTRETVALDLIDSPAAPIHHISLAREAAVFCIAPCTANVLNKLACGIADDLLTTTALATQAPLLVAPAMNKAMWDAAATQESCSRLRAHGVRVIEPSRGELACGEEGAGRLAELEHIRNAVILELRRQNDLAGMDVLVTAGPTREPLDPVRFISSPSSGLTGFLVAQEAARRGASVSLIAGPVSLDDPPGVKVTRVTTAAQMLDAARAAFERCDAAVFSAAVSDYRPVTVANEKLKKGRDLPADSTFTLTLTPNPDILATLAAGKGKRLVIGFAAETSDVCANALAKLKAKNADLIVANDVSLPGLGFASQDNSVWFVTADAAEASGVVSKRQLASMICDRIATRLGRLAI